MSAPTHQMTPAEKIRQALRSCIDPELGIDVVSLGLIYDIAIKNDHAVITMTLTTPGCPLVPYFRETILKTARQASGLDQVKIDITFDPPWNPSKMDADARKQLAMMRS